MFDFGDELTIGSYRIPWLIWIQILVMVLLILLLYSFTATISLSALDLSDGSSTASASLYPESRFDKMPVLNHTSTLVSARIQTSQVSPGTSRGIIRAAEDGVEMEECSGNQNCYHPCYYLKLAKLAFLKCLGLDSLSEGTSKTTERRKQR